MYAHPPSSSLASPGYLNTLPQVYWITVRWSWGERRSGGGGNPGPLGRSKKVALLTFFFLFPFLLIVSDSIEYYFHYIIAIMGLGKLS